MAGTEVFKSVWMGKKFISIGDTKVKDNQIQFKKLGGFLSGFTPVLANANDIPYQERMLWVPGTGEIPGSRVRIYMCDLMLDKYYAMINPQDINAINHLRKENQSLHQEIERLFEMLMDASNEDRWKKRIKKEMEHYSAIKGYGYSSLGGGGGLSSFPPTSPDETGGF